MKRNAIKVKHKKSALTFFYYFKKQGYNKQYFHNTY